MMDNDDNFGNGTWKYGVKEDAASTLRCRDWR
jgi:hypothetical protein